MELLAERAECTPDALALLAPGRAPLTYGRLYQHVDTVVQRLQTMGVGRHDRVAVVLPNGPELAVSALAVAACGICAPLNPAYGAHDFDRCLAELHAEALLVQAGADSPARAIAVAQHMRIIEITPILGAEAGWFTLAGDERTVPGSSRASQPDDVAVLLHTSGTTSRPKRVPLTHANICLRAHHKCLAHHLVASDRCLNVMPLYYAHGVIHTLLPSLMAGASVVCTPGFDAATFFAWIAAFRPTWYTASPALHHAVLEHAAQYREVIAAYPLRFIRSGTAPLPPQSLEALERLFAAPVIETYGLTETSTIAWNPEPPFTRKTGSVGIPMELEVGIMDSEGSWLPCGATGEIVVRGPSVMQAYDNDPTANNEAFRRGWFRTGDLGCLNADGYLFLRGRIKEMINRGGEKIVPGEVEEVLMAHPAVAQAVVFAVPHARLGEDIAAAVVLRPSAVAGESELRQYTASRLAAFKLPQRLLIVDDIPKSPTGKWQRLGLAEKFGLTDPSLERPRAPTDIDAPSTSLEKVLAGIWAQVLEVGDIGIHDNFFALGGDSILATQLISRVREVMHAEIAFRTVFEFPTIDGMARRIGAASQTSLSLQVPPLQPVPRDDPLPLSFAQQRLWFLEQLDPSRAVYHLPLAWCLSGTLDLSALEQSLNALVQGHEILRTSFPAVDGRPVQVIAAQLALPLPVRDLQAFPAREREAIAQQLATEEARRPFDLSRGPLIRAILLRMSDTDHVLVVTLHHIIFDGWSAEVFWRSLSKLYRAISTGQPTSLPALPLQYADVTRWQRQWLQGQVLDAQLAYWKPRLVGALPALNLPTDKPRPPVQTFHGARQRRQCSAALTGALKVMSQREGVTLFMTLVAAFLTLLYRYTGQNDVVVGTPIAGRTRRETEDLLGFFVNTLVLRTDLSGNPRFRELLRRVRAVTLGAYDHQDLPFEKLVEALQPVRDLSRHPLVQVMIALQPPPLPVTELPGLTVRPMAIDCGTAKFELTLSFQETDQGLLGTLEYNTDLFRHATITKMLDHFCTLLESVSADPDQRLADIALLPLAERRQLGIGWNLPSLGYPLDTCLHTLFEAQVERTPDAVALVCGRQQLSYWALNQRANQLAHHLRALGVGPEVCVGVCVDHSLEMVIGILGILKAAAAYVPLDPTCPAERLAIMMADAQVRVLVTQRQWMSVLPPHAAQVVSLETALGRMAPQSEVNPYCEATCENLAYVMYTSGSTGSPKGVMIEHRQAVAFLYGLEDLAPGGEETIGTIVCPFGFDVSVWECFAILCFGGTLHVVPAERAMVPQQYANYVATQRITSAYIPPPLLSEMAAYLVQQPAPIALNRLLVGVEPIKQDTLQRFRNLSEPMQIINGYGPTETTVCATLFPFRTAMEPERRTPIGTGIAGYEVYLVDANLQPVPAGVPGELLIGGAGLARGYVNHPELTAECFIPHPFSHVPGARLYKTGDLARRLPDGDLEFLGRRDLQVKLHGYRIELEEVEAVLRQHPAVREAAVLAWQDGHHHEAHLVAYMVVDPELTPGSGTWRRFLMQKLPTYMLPSTFIVLASLPRTANGKLDRQALPIPTLTPASSITIFVAPRTPVEYTLARIWAGVLRLERIGIQDNFFELGGDSLLAIQIVAQANREGLGLTPKDLFQHQTIAELALAAGGAGLTESEPAQLSPPLPPALTQDGFSAPELPEGSAENIEAIYPLSPLQQGILFHTLYAGEPGMYSAQWSCTLHADLDVSAFQRAWQRIVDRHPVLRTAFHWDPRNEPVQLVYRQVEIPWQQQDWRSMSAAEQTWRVEALLREDRAQGFELSTPPLMRMTLIQLAEATYQCVWSMHHLLLDAWSLALLLQEVSRLYEAFRADEELHLGVSRPYGDYIAWLQQQDLSQAEAFWRQTLQGLIAPTQLSVESASRPSQDGKAGYGEQHIRLSAALTQALQAMAQQHHLSVNTLVQGAWALLLNRYSGQEDVMFGATVAGRPTELAGMERMIGLLINTLPVRVRVSPEASLIPWLQELQSQQAEARRYDYSPLVQVQGWSDVPRGVPLFESLLVFENYPMRTAMQAASDSLEMRQVRFISRTHYPVTVVVVPEPELGLRIKYQCDRFSGPTISRMLGHLQALLEGMVVNPAQRLADLAILQAAERHQLVVELNATSTVHPQDMCIHQLFEAQAARTPDAVAVVCGEQELTYQELNRRANQLAHHLQGLGVGPEVLVGLYVERSLEMAVGLLGILKAGGAYVPFDQTYPQQRLTGILRAAHIPVLVTQQWLIAGVTQPATQVICLDTDWKLIDQEGETTPVTDVTPRNLLYVMYTSGSTGTPKGVAVEHRQLGNYLHGVKPRLALPDAAYFATVSTLAADLGNTPLFMSLCTGGCLHVLAQEQVADPDAVAEYFQCHAIDCLKIVPSHLAALQSGPHPEYVLPRRQLILGGEASQSKWIESLQALAPDCTILNHYGPTETTVGVLTYQVEDQTPVSPGSTLPLGRPLANTQTYVLDRYLQPVPVGVQGELYIGGAGLARGYLNQSMLTAEQFMPDPFSPEPGARLYQTRDLARYLPDGNIEFLGRVDNQVKIHGYRIELGEVETILEQHPAIRQAVVLVREDIPGDKRLVAYCVLRDGYPADSREWRNFLQSKLANYMVPGAFVVLEELPLTPNGKVDRKALPASNQARLPRFPTADAPRTPIEEILVDIWGSVLGVQAVGIHDNFFELGGHSLLAVQVMSRLRKVFQRDVPLRVLFDTLTVAGLARCVEMACQTMANAPVAPITATPREGAIPLTMTQEHLWGLDRLLPGAPFSNMPYAVRLTGVLNVAALEWSFNEVIKRHESLRTTFATVAGQVVQRIAPSLHLPIRVIDLRAVSQNEQDATAQRLVKAMALYPLDLEKGPLLEIRLVCLREHEHILLLTMHHIISDGWSRDVLLQEVAVLYDAYHRGKESPLPPLVLQYADYAYWQQQWLHSEAGKAQLEFWTEQLRDPLPTLQLPSDHPRTEGLSLRTSRQSFRFPGELCEGLTQFSRQEGTTLFMTLVTGLKMLLYCYTGQEDIRLGTLVANRQHQETEAMIGLLANLVILRTDVSGNPTLRQVLHRVRSTTLEAHAYQELPFEYLARTLVREGRLDRLSLFQVMFTMQPERTPFPPLPELTSDILETQPIDATPCELVVSVRASPHGIEGVCQYKVDLFEEGTITHMLEDFQDVLACLIAQPHAPIVLLNTFRDASHLGRS